MCRLVIAEEAKVEWFCEVEVGSTKTYKTF